MIAKLNLSNRPLLQGAEGQAVEGCDQRLRRRSEKDRFPGLFREVGHRGAAQSAAIPRPVPLRRSEPLNIS